MNKKWENFSEEELKDILITSFSYKEALKKIGYTTYSHNNKIIKEIAKLYNIDISHYIHTTLKNLAGQRFGRLLVINRDTTKESGHGKKVYWNCICDCGKKKSIPASSLLQGTCQSCGCLQRERTSQAEKLNLLGERFGKLVVIGPSENIVEPSGQSRTAWKCKCDCGNECTVKTINLRAGDTQSCGCIYSKGEHLIETILKENNFCFKKEFTFDDLLTDKGFKMRFDFAIFQDEKIICLIEFQGIQHYHPWDTVTNAIPLDERKERDQKKREYCKEKGYKLIEIPYWEYQNIDINYLKEKMYEYCD